MSDLENILYSTDAPTRMKAIILAGGLGTRLRPLTNETPKPLLPVKGKPILLHTMLNLQKHGITDIILSIGYKADKIQEYFGDGSKWGLNIDYAIETEPLGTGGAVKYASQGIDNRFIVLNGDNVADYDYTSAIEHHEKHKAKITLGLYPVEDVTKFGIAELNGHNIVRFLEKPSVEEAPTNLNNAGLYIIEPGVLDMLPKGKSSIEKDCFEKLCGADSNVVAFQHTSQWFPTDDIEKYNKADNYFIPP